MFDLSNLKKISRLGAAAPAAMKGFQELDKAALADGAISKKHKELIAVGVALTTQCGYCLEVHRKAAIAAGATEQELGRGDVCRSRLARWRRTYPRHPSHGRRGLNPL